MPNAPANQPDWVYSSVTLPIKLHLRLSRAAADSRVTVSSEVRRRLWSTINAPMVSEDDVRPLGKGAVPLSIRLQCDLRDALRSSAERNRRSLAAEVVYRLEDSFVVHQGTTSRDPAQVALLELVLAVNDAGGELAASQRLQLALSQASALLNGVAN